MKEGDEFDAVEEVKSLLGKKEPDDERFTFSVPLRIAIEIGIHLDFPRMFGKLEREKGVDPEAEARVRETWRALLGDPLIHWADDPNSLLKHVASNTNVEDTQPIPPEETLLYAMADQFPTIHQLETEPETIRDRLEEPYPISLNYKEINAIGHSILHEVFINEESRHKSTQQERVIFGDVDIVAIRMDVNLAKAFLSLHQAFVNAGGEEDKTLKEALERFANRNN